MASLFKNGHFKNVQFRKIARQVYSTVFMWAIIYGNLYCRNIVHAKTINVPWQRGQHHIIGCEKIDNTTIALLLIISQHNAIYSSSISGSMSMYSNIYHLL